MHRVIEYRGIAAKFGYATRTLSAEAWNPNRAGYS